MAEEKYIVVQGEIALVDEFNPAPKGAKVFDDYESAFKASLKETEDFNKGLNLQTPEKEPEEHPWEKRIRVLEERLLRLEAQCAGKVAASSKVGIATEDVRKTLTVAKRS